MSTERRSAPNARLLLRRLLLHLAFSLALLAASLGVGMWGYSYFEQLPWRDAFLNAAMLLGGMGPVKLEWPRGWSTSVTIMQFLTLSKL